MMTSSNHSFKPKKIKTAAKPPPPPPHQPSLATTTSPPPVLKCPRCDSLNTKFCYYNNYSLSQPRHYCKNCRRYWTRGGALRNVPIGGSTRNKNKPCTTLPHVITSPPQNVTSSSSHHLLALDGFRVNNPPPPPPPPPAPSSFSGYMFPVESSYNLASSTTSIESLSSLNQDLHHKLQQQRLMMTSMFLHQDSVPVNDKPVMFQNVPSTAATTDWVFDRSSALGRGGGRGGGGDTSGSNENNGEAEGSLGIWYHNANNNNYLL